MIAFHIIEMSANGSTVFHISNIWVNVSTVFHIGKILAHLGFHISSILWQMVVFHINKMLANGSISQYQHFVNGGILNQHSLKYQRPIWGIFTLIVHIPIQMTGLC